MSKPGTATRAKVRVNYCDTDQLELDWYDWLLASAVPALEDLRQTGILWTRTHSCAGAITKGDPYHPQREHCIALPTPFYCTSTHGIPGPLWRAGNGDTVTAERIQGMLSLESDDPHLCLDMPYLQRGVVIPSLVAAGFRRERGAGDSWRKMADSIGAICKGVAQKFRPPSEEERDDLAHEALLQVMRKLRDGRLKYTPGKAPVFNLLTTTIYRCMFTVKARTSKQRTHATKLANDLCAGTAPRSFRSLRVPGTMAIRPYPRQ